ncbi:MAG TPA: cupin domain-containing protein [Gaiellaceae bacterium]
MATATRFTIVHTDDLERSGRWALVRRSLELRSFGANMVEIQPGTQIPEHDETERDQEEVFLVLQGDAVAVLDGVRYAAPAGTFVRADPEVVRTIANDSDAPATVLIVSAPRSSGYEPLDWA